MSYLIGQKKPVLTSVQKQHAAEAAEAAAERLNKERELSRQRREADVKNKRAAEKQAVRETEEKRKTQADVLRMKKLAEAKALKEAEALRKAQELESRAARVEAARNARNEAQQQQQQHQHQLQQQHKDRPSTQPPRRRVQSDRSGSVPAAEATDRTNADELQLVGRARSDRASSSRRRRRTLDPDRIQSWSSTKGEPAASSRTEPDTKSQERAERKAQRLADRNLEQKQRIVAVEQRVDDSIEDEPAGAYRKQLAAEHRQLRKESARILSQRNAQLSQRLSKVSSRVLDDIRNPPKSPQASSRSRTSKQTGSAEEPTTDRAGTTTRGDASEETGWLHKMFAGFNSPEPSTVRARMGVATASLVRINDGVNEDQATLHHRREQERIDAALVTNRQPWDASARHYVPSALRGLRPLTKEPWAYERNEFDIFGSAWDENGELRPSTATPLARTPYAEHLPRKTATELSMPTATSRSKQKAPTSSTAKARKAERLKEEEEQARLAEELRSREVELAAQARAQREHEAESERQHEERVTTLRAKMVDGLLLSTEEKVFLDSAMMAEELATVRQLLRNVSASSDAAPPSDEDVVLLKELVGSQLHRLQEKQPLLTAEEQTLMEELEASERQMRFGGFGSGGSSTSALATSLPSLLDMLLRTFMPKCAALW